MKDLNYNGILKSDAAATPERIISDAVRYADLVLSDAKPIGFGTFALVYKMWHKLWGCELAYKKLNIRYWDDTNEEDSQ